MGVRLAAAARAAEVRVLEGVDMVVEREHTRKGRRQYIVKEFGQLAWEVEC